MNRDLLLRIMDDARDAAPSPADEDEIRVLMIDLGLMQKPIRPLSPYIPPKTRKPRK